MTSINKPQSVNSSQKAYPNAQNLHVYAPSNRLIELRLKAAGYDFDASQLKCALPDNIVSADWYVARSAVV
jgi:hypothetical protein